MALGQAFDEADELLTLLAVIPVLLALLVFVNNMGNPNYDAIQAFNRLITSLIHALVPNIGAILALGALIWLVRTA
jgi:hypothetical protein